MLTISIGSLP